MNANLRNFVSCVIRRIILYIGYKPKYLGTNLIAPYVRKISITKLFNYR